MPTAVIFDVGRVLIHWDPRFLYKKLITDPEELEWFLREVVNFEWHHEHDRGLPFAAGLAQRALAFPEYRGLIYAFRERWRETIPGEIAGSVEILRTLHGKGVPCFALTNYSAETWPELEAEFDWVRCFKDIVVSGREGLVKPEAPIYHLAKRRFGLQDGEGLFIDDKKVNVEAAVAAGFLGHHFTGAETLRAELKRLALL
ncbi:MAG TPA: HAD family phosphatase [Sphingomonadales bacterium]|nr:HAD family phosphatase [Sphingomonadales bacterium]